jgi:hypothetical protein
MNIKAGDKVKVISKNTTHEGKTGEVIGVYEDAQTCRVKLEWAVDGSEFSTAGIISGFFVSELEVLKAVDEAEQIQALASILYNADFALDWDFDQAHDEATKLYKKGVRHEG